MKRLRKAARWCLWLGVLAATASLAASAHVYYQGKAHVVAASTAKRADTILVLGAGVYTNGHPSAVLEDRLRTALDLYMAGRAPKLLCSGDHGSVNYDEVNVMRRWLERKGVPRADIFMDHAGFDTYDTMVRARQVFCVRSAIVVTQRFHLPRALYIANKVGVAAEGVEADRRTYLDAYEAREAAARVKAFLDVSSGARPTWLGPVIPISGDGRATQG